MTDGYIYCLSNPSITGMVKVGMTLSPDMTPDKRAKKLFTTGVPMPFNIEFAKKVKDPRGKEASLHKLLEIYTDRVCPCREFFRTSPEVVRNFFDLIDGVMWSGNIYPLISNGPLVVDTESITHENKKTTNATSLPFDFIERKGIRLVTEDASRSYNCVQVKFSNLEQALIYANENGYNCVTKGATGNRPCFYWFQKHTEYHIDNKIYKDANNSKIPDKIVSYYKYP
jgi:hypothetical protein